MRRRMGIVGVIVAFFTVVVVLPYWYTHREIPTCFDGKQNQGELSIDCGSPCAVLCKGQAKDLNILWTKVFPVRTGAYDVVAYVENPNFDIGSNHFTYTAILYDADGQVIASRVSDDFVLPSERFVLFAGGMLTGDKVASKGSIEVNPDFTWVTTQKSGVSFSVTDKLLIGADQKPILTAVLHNDTPRLYRNVNVNAVIYDSKHNPIGVSSTRVEKIEPNGAEKLSFTWPDAFNYVAETEECEQPVDVMLLLDRSGSMASESKDPPQPFTRVRDAAASFTTFLTQNDQVGMVSFSTAGSNPVDLTLTANFDRAQKRIEGTNMGTDGIQFTNTGDAIFRAVGEFATQRANDAARKIIILLTDGEALEPNRPLNPQDPKDRNFASLYAIEQANNAKKYGILLYTIGLGINVNDEFLKTISTGPNYYYPAPSAADLRGVYKQIANAICKKNPSVIEIIPRVNDVTPTPTAP